MTEDEAYAAFLRFRWPETNGLPICPRCGADHIYDLTTRRRFKCAGCGQQFSATTGTAYAYRKLTYTTIMASLRTAASPAERSRSLGIGYKTAHSLGRDYKRPAEAGKKMKHVPLSQLEGKIIRPGIEEYLTPLIMYRGRVTLGDAHRMWNLIVSGMEHEATIADMTQRLQKNDAYSQLCCPTAVKPKMAICSFLTRLEDNPRVMDEMPGLAEYVDWLGGWRFDLTPVSEITHSSRNTGAGGWRTFVDRRVKPIPPDFKALAQKMTTTELVVHYGVSFPTITKWRRKAGIPAPPRHWSRRPADLVYPFLIHDGGRPEHALLRKVNAAVPHGLDHNLRADVCQDLIVGILAGDLSEDDLHLPRLALSKRLAHISPAKWIERSLEDRIGDDFTIMDTLADEGRDWA